MIDRTKPRNFVGLKYLSMMALTGWTGNAFSGEKVPADKPNIVLIMADDMGYSDIGCYGSAISTPNIDKLAAQGVRFRNFYNNAKCCPTRASLLTGLNNHEAGMGNMVTMADAPIQPGPYQGFLNQNSVTIAEVLRTAGYSTYLSGKWHLGERKEHWPLQRGFDKYFGLISGASSYFEIIEEPRKRVMAYGNESWTPPNKGFYMTDAISDTAVAFIQKHSETKKKDPFFLYVAYTSPHWPLHALDEDIRKYEGKFTQGWDSLRNQQYRRMLKLGIIEPKYKLSPRTDGISHWKDAEDKDLWIRRMQVYAAMIDRMDQGIGRVVDALRKANQLENSLIIFLADNGGCAENASSRNLGAPGIPVGERGSYDSYKEPWANVSNTPYRYYKNWLYEGGIRTPLIVYWPKVVKNSGVLTDQPGHVVDFMPTFLEVAGVKYPEQVNNHPITPMRGASLVPAFTGKEIARSQPFFWEYVGEKAMRKGDWKLVKTKTGNWELYNLKDDPTELTDLSTKRPETLKELVETYNQWAGQVGVKEVKQKQGGE
ncbi:MAG: arylsulfatase [Prolixibacteraceae bacterium]|nr:arylsulfatase [Prolixibacteraceae bacterium]